MLRLTLLLCIGMYAALMIAGEDRGQMRPGLAAAAAKNVQPEAVAGGESAPAEVAEAAVPEAEPVPELAVTEPEPEAPVVAAPAALVAAAEPEPYVEPQRELVTELEEPVFSLASIGNERVPGAPAEESAAPEVPAGGEGTIWYVTARSVNVRAGPSTDTEVVGKLASGEATLVVQAVDEDWARIVIQGDGVEGFVAIRYLSAEAP
jgi:uncharacterized protein YgiM (DUF1202 family)